ncbi:Gfo/Idh/MocA family oxidoreductase [uncultured Chitinophaga sp.]|uniref:Gfo/Idh/MocA family protein n=1 Tax=uncultured Chitinophaga sp. TaxID=339340 RepID=UPI0025E3D533|nr:Gfo/Idh/MocA family oxidoreductase [uncultured Chitinophaga sp.]
MKVLFIGLGSIATRHLNALRQLVPGVQLYALRSGIGQSFGWEGINELFNADDIPADIDFGIISNPTFRHAEAVEILLARSIPIFLEKPLAHQLDGLEQLVSRVEKSGLISYVACNLRFLPSLVFLRNHLLQANVIVNEVNVYCGSYLPNWRPGKDFRDMYSTRPEMGGGVHLDLFHELDYTCWLFGMPQEVDVLLRNNSTLRIAVPDYANYRLLYKGFTAQVTLNYFRRDSKRELEVVTADGTFTLDLSNNHVTNETGEILFHEDGAGIAQTYLFQMEYFLKVLRGEEKSFNTLRDSLSILKICLADERKIK